MAMGRPAWRAAREALQRLLSGRDGELRDNPGLLRTVLVPEVRLHIVSTCFVGQRAHFMSTCARRCHAGLAAWHHGVLRRRRAPARACAE